MSISHFKSHLETRLLFAPIREFSLSYLREMTRCLFFIVIPMSNPHRHICLEQTFKKTSVPPLSFLPCPSLPHNFGILCIHVLQSFKTTSVMVSASFYLHLILIYFESEGGYASLNFTITFSNRCI